MTSINPVRYPGGKGRKAVVDGILSLVPSGRLQGRTWIEPFCGGCGLGLELVNRGIVSRAVFNDADRRVIAMWHEIAYDSEWLIARIFDADIDMRLFLESHDIANDDAASVRDVGFATFVLDRCCVSGYIDGGVIGGKHQNGRYKLDCRFNKDTLAKRIRRVSELASGNRVSFVGPSDAIDVIDGIHGGDTFLYVDPPYYQKGHACYRTRINHEELAECLRRRLDDGIPWLLSYDDCNEIRDMYQGCHFARLPLTYVNNSVTRGRTSELLVSNFAFSEGRNG